MTTPDHQPAAVPIVPSLVDDSAEQLAEDAARSARQMRPSVLVAGMAAIVAVTVLVRMLNLTFPMGQPAGTAAFVGRRWMAGEVPYRDAWDNQGPALYLMAGLITDLIGISPAANRLAMMAIDLATMLLIYLLVRRWNNRTEALVAAGVFGFFSGALLVQGDCLATGPPMNFLYVLAVLSMLRSDGHKLRWLALSGFAAGLAICFSLVASIYLAALLLWILVARKGSTSRAARWGLRPVAILAAAALPVAAFAAYFATERALDDLWNSTIIYNWLYYWPFGRHMFVSGRLKLLWGLIPEQGALWLFAGGWAIHAFSIGYRRETRLLTLWCGVAMAGALAARHVSAEHFIQTIPPLAIAAALAVTNPSERFLRRNAAGRLETSSGMLVAFSVVLFLAFLYTEVRILRYRVKSTVLTTDRAAYEVGRLIYKNTEPGEKIYLWGSRPQIYVYAQRAAACRFFYNWPLNSTRRVSEFFEPILQPKLFDYINRTLTEVVPAFVVTTELQAEGSPDPSQLGPIAPWFAFMRRHYRKWKTVEARPYSYTIFVRKDRKLR